MNNFTFCPDCKTHTHARVQGDYCPEVAKGAAAFSRGEVVVCSLQKTSLDELFEGRVPPHDVEVAISLSGQRRCGGFSGLRVAEEGRKTFSERQNYTLLRSFKPYSFLAPKWRPFSRQFSRSVAQGALTIDWHQ